MDPIKETIFNPKILIIREDIVANLNLFLFFIKYEKYNSKIPMINQPTPAIIKTKANSGDLILKIGYLTKNSLNDVINCIMPPIKIIILVILGKSILINLRQQYISV